MDVMVTAGPARAALLGLALLCAACSGSRPAPRDEPAREVGIGYGTVEQRNLTTAVSSLDAEDLEAQRVARVEEMLQGRFAGVQVARLPGGNYSIRIRGQSSIRGSGEPLVVVDGMPLLPGSLGGMDPRDIARIEVLKDAGATAIYGSRGGNGVILITTKRAR
jgi:iron complex outermembrane receptor protein